MNNDVITVNELTYKGIRTGMRSCLIVDEDQRYIVNTELVVIAEGADQEAEATRPIIVSVNSLTTHNDEQGLKKGFSLLCVSVVR